MRYLVLGNGAAGVTAAAKLREMDETASITVASAEDVPAYSKIMLPDYVGGSLERNKLFIRDEVFYEKNNIKLLKNKRAKHIDTRQSEVLFGDGSIESYDKLLIATGSIPFIPRLEGLENIRYFTINSLEDADIICKNARPGENAVIIGGGLTGIEMAFALRKLGMKVTIIELNKLILQQQLDDEASDIMTGHLKKEGIAFVGGASVSSIEAGYTGAAEKGNLPEAGIAVLSDGDRLEFCMLLAAIGTRPLLDYIEGTDIKKNRGIIVDENLKSSADNIYAAGDAAEAAQTANGYVSSYIWPNAMAQGKTAAINMAGGQQAFAGTSAASNMTQLRDMQYVSMGLVKPGKEGFEILKYIDADKLVYRKLILKNNIPVGMILIGDVRKATEFASLIRKGAAITDMTGLKNNLQPT